MGEKKRSTHRENVLEKSKKPQGGRLKKQSGKPGPGWRPGPGVFVGGENQPESPLVLLVWGTKKKSKG